MLRSQVPSGSTVMVDKPSGSEDGGEPSEEVKLTVIEPAPQPTPVGVGAQDGGEEDTPEPPEPDAPAETE